MGAFFHLLFTIGAVAFPFVAMVLMWRRMKKVREKAYHESASPNRAEAWEDVTERDRGLNLVRRNKPSAELIEMGDKARHARWPLDNP
ncbi:hypothetical protein ASE00_12050 [Sphingomonas sp. Root710]|uniref:hypothetical protein n=1 Tax=Sphingomonas sp. Root710 TaxID=1736594 RepID=UPI0006F7DA2C|nr:hypothetical protein [Sphingomonas sp. Root710]KRB82753.1 hypothetical protein ASE00_12050 [Sphingomonas sp. Root710]